MGISFINSGKLQTVNTITPDYQTMRESYQLADGRYLVVWVNEQEVNGVFVREYKGRIFDKDGTPAGEEVSLHPENYKDNFRVSLSEYVGLKDGGFYTVWENYDPNSKFDLYLQRYDANGQKTGPEQVVVSAWKANGSVDYASNYHVTEMVGGALFVTWTVDYAFESGGDTFGRFYNRDGTPVGGVENITNSGSDGDYRAEENLITIVALKNGGFQVFWHADDRLMMQAYDASGAKDGARETLSSPDEEVTGFQAADGHAVAWIEENTGNVYDDAIRAVLYKQNGAVAGTIELNMPGYIQLDFLQIQENPKGGYIVSWLEGSRTGDTGRAQTLKVQYFSEKGGVALHEHNQVFNYEVSFDGSPRHFVVYGFEVITLKGGGVLQLWHQNITDPLTPYKPGDLTLQAQFLDKNGNDMGLETTLFQDRFGDGDEQIREYHVTHIGAGVVAITLGDDDTEIAQDNTVFFGASGNELDIFGALPTDRWGDDVEGLTLTSLAFGDFLVSWTLMVEVQGFSYEKNVLGQVFSADGQTIGETQVLTKQVADGFGAGITALPNGGFSVSFDGWPRPEDLKGYDYDNYEDDFNIFTRTFDRVLLGGKAKDVLKGTKGEDVIWGKAGNDVLKGRAGDDTLDGGKGADKLEGGSGDDVLKGGGGADRFVFKKGFGKDVITDFQDDKDTLLLNNALWSGTLSVQQVINRFAGVVDGDIVFDFGRNELTISGFTDIAELKDDISII